MVHGATIHQTNVRRRSGGNFSVATRVMWALIITAGMMTLGFTFYPEWARLDSMRRDAGLSSSSVLPT